MVHFAGWLKPWHYRWEPKSREFVIPLSPKHPLYTKAFEQTTVAKWWFHLALFHDKFSLM